MTDITRDQLLKDLDDLKAKADVPALFLANYFSNLRSEVDKEIVTRQNFMQTDKQKKNLNVIWHQIIARIDLFEKECVRHKLDLDANKQRIVAIKALLNDNGHTDLKAVKDTIDNEELSIMGALFQNKTIFFIDENLKKKLKYTRLVIVNDEYIGMKSIEKM